MEHRQPYRAKHLLCVEQQPENKAALQEVFEGVLLLQIVDSGSEAMDVLQRCGHSHDLVVLNCDAPQALDTLELIKGHPELRSVPVIAISSHWENGLLRRAYDLGANCCIRQPDGVEERAQVMRAINQFWRQLAVVPRPTASAVAR